jgi:2,3-bisphosphoglycerate-independent phosphoglycerate mutase
MILRTALAALLLLSAPARAELDAAARIVVEAARERGMGVTILADHGNADKMRNPDGSPHTAHTTVLVPHLVIAEDVSAAPRPGKLGDVAPTILHLLGLTIPESMTGDVLV